MTAGPEPTASRDAAVIDIGSNSVRLVLYRLEGRAVWTVYNEKVLAGLGRDLPRTGRLSEAGIGDTLPALKRFRAVLDAVRPSELHVVATAAVREATDGRVFCDRVAAETGLNVRVLSGEEEARYAALGVAAGAPDATGLAADLGGTSLELTRLEQGRPEGGITLPLGPFAVQARTEKERADRIEAVLEQVPPGHRGDVLHAVGGAWRALALLHMRKHAHPLQIVHQYALPVRDLTPLSEVLSKASKGSLERTPGLSKKRIESLPHAALVLERLAGAVGAQTICFSAFGLREGLLFDAMPAEVRQGDPLLAGCRALGLRQGVTDLAEPMAAWLGPVLSRLAPWAGPERDRTLLRASAALADLGARLHPDHRADLAFDQVVRAPIAGWTHAERAFVASAVHARYGGGAAGPDGPLALRLLGEEGLAKARIMGLGLRLAFDLSGRSAVLLAGARLTLEGDSLVLGARPDQAAIILGEQTAKRANALAQALGLSLRIEQA